MLRIVTRSPQESMKLGRWLGERLRPRDFVALTGQLGAGKTRLSSGILAGLGIARTGGSPTFTLLWEYRGRFPIYHWDVYRLGSPRELDDLGYEEYFDGDGVNLVEWADRIESLWPEEYLLIHLEYGSEEQERVISLTGTARFQPLLKELTHANIGL